MEISKEDVEEMDEALLGDEAVGTARRVGAVVLKRTRSMICITPLLTKKSVRMMFAVTPLRVTEYCNVVGSCVKVKFIPESAVYCAD